MCPPCVYLVSVLAVPPNLVRHVSASRVRLLFVQTLSAICPLCHRLVSPRFRLRFQTLSALCPPLVSASCVSTMCPPGPWHHETFFSALCNPAHLYCMPAGQLPWHSLWLANTALQAHPMLEKLFGVYAGIIAPQTVYRGGSLLEKKLAAICPGHCILYLGFVYVFRCPDFYIETGHAVCLYSAGPRPNHLSLGFW